MSHFHFIMPHPEKDYTNWLISLDSDNFSSFIKIWFAYLATIHEIVLKECSGEEKERLIHQEQGDSIFLKKYSSQYFGKLNISTSTKETIKICYYSSQIQIKEIVPQRFFILYYKKIEDVEIYNKEPITIHRDNYKLDTSIRHNNLHIGILIEPNSPIFAKMQDQYIELKIPLEPKLKKTLTMVENNDLFYKHLSNQTKVLFKKIKANKNTKEYIETEKKLQVLIQIIINYTKDINLHKIIYKEKITPASTDKDAIEWLHEFSYGLRNILFHKVINPFDKEWAKIVKYTSQALYDIVMLNINILEKNTNS